MGFIPYVTRIPELLLLASRALSLVLIRDNMLCKLGVDAVPGHIIDVVIHLEVFESKAGSNEKLMPCLPLLMHFLKLFLFFWIPVIWSKSIVYPA